MVFCRIFFKGLNPFTAIPRKEVMPKILNRPTESSLMSNYSRSDLAFVSGKGVWLLMKKEMFLDLASGIAVNSLATATLD